VRPSGSGFDIVLYAVLSGTSGGTVAITSPPSEGAVTTSGGVGISASFLETDMGTFTSTDCTITFTYMGEPVPVSPPVAAGRIWGHLECPDALEANHLGTGPDGGATVVTCPVSADFLFEQCAQ
jgi:hypothetical protein